MGISRDGIALELNPRTLLTNLDPEALHKQLNFGPLNPEASNSKSRAPNAYINTTLKSPDLNPKPSTLPQVHSNIPQIPTIKGHKDSKKGPLIGPGSSQALRALLRHSGATGYLGIYCLNLYLNIPKPKFLWVHIINPNVDFIGTPQKVGWVLVSFIEFPNPLHPKMRFPNPAFSV